jgi:predicted HicB family RNase H-like nuclease
MPSAVTAQANQLMTLRLPPELYRWLRQEAYRRQVGMNALVLVVLDAEQARAWRGAEDAAAATW